MVIKQEQRLSGAQLLSRIIKLRGRGGCNAVGAEIKCGGGNVSRWARGLTVPGPDHRITMLALYGIPFDAWPAADRKPRKAPVKAKAPKKKAA